MDNGEIPIAIFVDLSKGFDTIDNEILINKLSFYVVRGCANGLIRSYLTNRTQYVEMEGILSDTLLVTVPQISILSPLLSLIFINDIVYATKRFELLLYVDGSIFIKLLGSFNTQSNSFNDSNVEFDKISAWLKINKLSLNVSK